MDELTPRHKPRILLSTQSLLPGNGGICAVARMSATALSSCYETGALSCEDRGEGYIGSVKVRAFGGHRVLFALNNILEAQRATHVFYDFAGTARAHFDFPFRRRPYALWVHGWELWERPPAKYLRALAGASLILSNSRYTLTRAGRVVPAGAAVEVCELGTSEGAEFGEPSGLHGPPVVMLLGRIDEMLAKGHDILIDIWPQVVSAVPRARLIFVGGGSALGKVRALAAASSARESIEITGFVAGKNLEHYWRQATIFAMPGFAEGFGLVYADAMRHGVPVIASTDDGGQEVNVDGVTGFNIARADRKRLVESLTTLLRDRDYARKLGSAGYERWRQRYAFEAFRKRLLAAADGFLSI